MNPVPPSEAPAEDRVLVLAPTGRDGAVICRSLTDAGMHAAECLGVPDLCRMVREGAGAAIVASEALSPHVVAMLAGELALQPAWSDLPLVILAPPSRSMQGMKELLARLGPTGTATVLERPVHVFSMVTTTQMALRSRRRQYQVRDQLVQSERQSASLRESEARFRELADAMPQIVWSARPDGYIDYYNRRWFEYTGMDEAYGDESWLPILHPDDVQPCLEAYRAALRTGELYEIEYRLKDRLTGGYRWHLGRALPARDDAGAIKRWYGTCIDIEQIVEARETLARGRDEFEALVAERTRELEASHQRLRTSERMASLGTLSAGLGHDMGNLLLPVRMRLQSLAESGLSPEAQEDLAAIRRAAEYLQRLASGLRLLAIDPAAGERSRECTDPLAWWDDVEPLLKNVLPRNVALECRMPPTPPRLRIGPSALTQAVFNLVQNAGEALRPRGTGRVEVWLEEAAGGVVRLGVSDDGPGMPPEVRARCLEPFYSTKPRAISTGLGLVLVSGLVHSAGGKVELDSAPGKGTTFTLTLHTMPAETGAEARPRAVVLLKDSRMQAFVCSLLRVLDVEIDDGGRNCDGATLWVTDGGNGSADAARAFVSGRQGRSAVVFGDGPGNDRVMMLGREPKPAAVRRALIELARGGVGQRA